MEAETTKSKIPHVCILLATFNGMKYLDEQISSIYGQIGVKLSILVQDDGSTDGTVEYLENQLKLGKIKSFTKSRRIGSTKVFINLLNMAPDAEYYAFSDQDDLWESTKLMKLTNLLGSLDSPGISFSGRILIDSEGYVMRSESIQLRHIGTRNALIQNLIPGNTSLINNSGRIFLSTLNSDEVQHYDSWIYLIFSMFGTICLSDEPLTRYRIHDDNQIGLGGDITSKVRSFETNLSGFKSNALSILKINSVELSAENQILLNSFLALIRSRNPYKRCLLLMRLRLYRKTGIQTLLFNLYLAFRKC
jgi:glycosyltransferase involved in cell wall biosynthesis